MFGFQPKMDDLEEGDKPDEGTKLFLNLVKLCIRLEEEAGSDDKRDWDAVFQLFGGVCDGIKAEMEVNPPHCIPLLY